MNKKPNIDTNINPKSQNQWVQFHLPLLVLFSIEMIISHRYIREIPTENETKTQTTIKPNKQKKKTYLISIKSRKNNSNMKQVNPNNKNQLTRSVNNKIDPFREDHHQEVRQVSQPLASGAQNRQYHHLWFQT